MSQHDLRLSRLALRKIEQAHGRDVDHDSLARRVRQDELRRRDDLLVRAWEPRVHARVGAQDLLVTYVETTRNVGECVLLRRGRKLHRTDEIIVRNELEPLRGRRQRLDRRRRQRWRSRWLTFPPWLVEE